MKLLTPTAAVDATYEMDLFEYGRISVHLINTGTSPVTGIKFYNYNKESSTFVSALEVVPNSFNGTVATEVVLWFNDFPFRFLGILVPKNQDGIELYFHGKR
jgi:hypothetical protein